MPIAAERWQPMIRHLMDLHKARRLGMLVLIRSGYIPSELGVLGELTDQEATALAIASGAQVNNLHNTRQGTYKGIHRYDADDTDVQPISGPDSRSDSFRLDVGDTTARLVVTHPTHLSERPTAPIPRPAPYLDVGDTVKLVISPRQPDQK